MVWLKSFKGYEDELDDLDRRVNDWIRDSHAEVVDVEITLAFQPGQKSGDVIYTLLFKRAGA